VKVTFW